MRHFFTHGTVAHIQREGESGDMGGYRLLQYLLLGEGGDETQVEGVGRAKVDGQMGMQPPPSACWAKNTIITECTQETILQSTVLSSLCSHLCVKDTGHRTYR